MKPIKDFDKIKAAGTFERLPVGGYVAKITKVENISEKECLHVIYDIAEGEYAGFFKDTDADHVWLHDFYQGYRTNPKTDKDKKTNEIFKRFTDDLESSNPGYKWDWQETLLTGKLIGVTIGEEEYMSNRGELRTGLKVRACMSAERIRKGGFKVPELKKLPQTAQPAIPAGFTEIKNDDLPF